MRPSWCLLGLLLWLPGSGCSPHATQAQLRATAARDLGCPADNLRFRQLDERRQWVAGCGKSNTYKEDCRKRDDGEERCGWERSGEDSEQQQP